jgi:hypothetical protein
VCNYVADSFNMGDSIDNVIVAAPRGRLAGKNAIITVGVPQYPPQLISNFVFRVVQGKFLPPLIWRSMKKQELGSRISPAAKFYDGFRMITGDLNHGCADDWLLKVASTKRMEHDVLLESN